MQFKEATNFIDNLDNKLFENEELIYAGVKKENDNSQPLLIFNEEKLDEESIEKILKNIFQPNTFERISKVSLKNLKIPEIIKQVDGVLPEHRLLLGKRVIRSSVGLGQKATSSNILDICIKCNGTSTFNIVAKVKGKESYYAFTAGHGLEKNKPVKLIGYNILGKVLICKATQNLPDVGLFTLNKTQIDDHFILEKVKLDKGSIAAISYSGCKTASTGNNKIQSLHGRTKIQSFVFSNQYTTCKVIIDETDSGASCFQTNGNTVIGQFLKEEISTRTDDKCDLNINIVNNMYCYISAIENQLNITFNGIYKLKKKTE